MMIAAPFRRLALLILLGLGVAGGWANAATTNAPQVAAIAPSRELLVLLRLPPVHYRPGGDGGDAYSDGAGAEARRRLAEQLAKAHGLSLVTDWPMPLLGVDCFVMVAPEGRTGEQAATDLSHEPAVSWAQPMGVYQAQAGVSAPNDPLFRAQPVARGWRLADLHQMSTGRGVRVAVVDSQVDTAHPDLAGQVVVQENFATGRPSDPERHGTGVAGVIAARADNGLGIVGVAPEARLMALRACWQTGPPGAATICDSLSLAKALHFAVDHHAQVINLSLAGPPDILLGRLIDVALARGITVVGAFDRQLPAGGFPASWSGVIAVTDGEVEAGRPNLYTAPGHDIPTTEPGGRWDLVNGSSFAAAHVTGLIALTRQGAHGQGSRDGHPLVVRSSGGALDGCATLIRAFGPCNCACSRLADSAVAVRR